MVNTESPRISRRPAMFSKTSAIRALFMLLTGIHTIALGESASPFDCQFEERAGAKEGTTDALWRSLTYAPWHLLYFLSLPQGHGSLRPTFRPPAVTGFRERAPVTRAMTLVLSARPLALPREGRPGLAMPM